MLSNENVGFWFLPGQENKVNGVLRRDKEKQYYLKLSGPLGDSNEMDEVPVVNGVLSSGESLTLFNVSVINEKWSFPGFPIYDCRVAIICIGALYDSIEEIQISNSKIAYKYLNYWLNETTINAIGNSSTNELSVNYKMPQLKTFELENMNLKFTYKFKTSGNYYSTFEMKQTELVEFDFKESVNFDDLLKEIQIFSDFLTLCFGKVSSKESISFKDINENKIELIYDDGQKEELRELKATDMFIKYSFIAEDFQNCYTTWKEKRDKLEPVIVYFIEAHDREFHIPMSFLKIVQALEAFSRRNRDNKLLSEEEFKELQDRLTNGLSEDDRDFVLDILSNEPRLRNRLQEIFKEVNNIFNLSNKKRKSLTNKIVDTRNYYTHFDNSLEAKKLETDGIFYVSQYMKLVLRTILLMELNVNETLINQRISSSGDFNYCMNTIDELFFSKE